MREGFELGVLLFRYEDAPAEGMAKNLYLSPVDVVVDSRLRNPKTRRSFSNCYHETPENLYAHTAQKA